MDSGPVYKILSELNKGHHILVALCSPQEPKLCSLFWYCGIQIDHGQYKHLLNIYRIVSMWESLYPVQQKDVL